MTGKSSQLDYPGGADVALRTFHFRVGTCAGTVKIGVSTGCLATQLGWRSDWGLRTNCVENSPTKLEEESTGNPHENYQ